MLVFTVATPFYILNNCTGLLVSPHPPRYLLFSSFLVAAILMAGRGSLMVFGLHFPTD